VLCADVITARCVYCALLTVTLQTTITQVRARALALVEQLVSQLRAAAADDDSGAVTLHVVDALQYVRTRFVADLLAQLAPQFEPGWC
jgi:hypothetical protein